ncbi:hypothetical protein [Campylobacter sp. US33a]|uniref:hypothetical protein n=1 Tax=Campylobacter sp. US33a TaxID=2498120 RepID=UPI00106783E7|nr:hypothetical protein [Campylobacter sp. US33a]TEY03420.1 hypothetical protein ELQ16_02375 [Campylobacter sp. US33a]
MLVEILAIYLIIFIFALIPLFALKFQRAKWLLLVFYILIICFWMIIFLDSSRNLLFVLTHFSYIAPLLCCVIGIFSFIWHKKEFFTIKFYLSGFYLFVSLCAFFTFFLSELPKNKGFYVDENNLYEFYIFGSIMMFLSMLGLFGIYKNKKYLLYFTYSFIIFLVILNSFYFST